MRVSILCFLPAAALAQVQSGQNYHGILATGQSLSTGCQGYASGQVTSGTPYSNLMLSAGTTALEAPSILQLDTAPLQALAPWNVCNNNGSPPDSTNPSGLPQENPALAALNQLTFMTGGASGNKYILGLHGASGRDYSVIGGPTDVAQPSANPSFANGQTQLTNMRAAVLAAGSTFQLDGVIVVHGESDDIEYNWKYDQNLNHFQWDYEAVSNAAIGRNGFLPMFIDQPSSWGFYHGTGATPNAGMLMWKAAEENPCRLFMVGPIYQFPSGAVGDGVHKSPAGYRALGELYGKAMYDVLVNHHCWRPVMPASITLSGSTVTAKFFVPVLPLQFDTTTIAAQTNKGFEFTDGRTAVVYRITQASGPAPTSISIADGGAGYASPPTITVNCGGCGATYSASITAGQVTSVTRTAAGSNATTYDLLFSAPTPSVAISSVSVSADTVTVNLSGTPTGPTPTLRYAYTAPGSTGGGLGNLKDSDISTGRTGSALFDWGVTFSAPIPFLSTLSQQSFAFGGLSMH